MSNIAKQIKRLRVKRGLTQAELAALLNTKAQVVSMWENPKYNAYTLTTLERLANALGARLELSILPNVDSVDNS